MTNELQAERADRYIKSLQNREKYLEELLFDLEKQLQENKNELYYAIKTKHKDCTHTYKDGTSATYFSFQSEKCKICGWDDY